MTAMSRIIKPQQQPKIIYRTSSGRNHKRTLIRCIAFVPVLFLLMERIFLFFPSFEYENNSNLLGYLNVENVAVTSTTKKSKKKAVPVAILPTISSNFTSTSTIIITAQKSLEMITQPFRVTDVSSSMYCPVKGTKNIWNYHSPLNTNNKDRQRQQNRRRKRRGKIPKIIHQQITSRCVLPEVHNMNQRLKQQLIMMRDHNDGREGDNNDMWSIFFHTEDAMTRLFRAIVITTTKDDEEKSELLLFPHLGQIVKSCIENGSLLKKQLWYFLCLYVYGGIYIDFHEHDYYNDDGVDEDGDYFQIIKELNTLSNRTIIHNDDANDAVLFVLENNDNDNDNQFNNKNSIKYTNTIAVSPRHPLIYYAVHQMIFKIIDDNDNDNNNMNDYVNDVLEKALADFQHDFITRGSEENSKVENSLNDSDNNNSSGRRIIYYGTDNKTVTIIGTTINKKKKRKEVDSSQSQSQTHHTDTTTLEGKSSCFKKLFLDSTRVGSQQHS